MTSDEQLAAFARMSAAWIKNRNAVPFEQLEPYRDQYVAWDPEVTRIIAATACSAFPTPVRT